MPIISSRTFRSPYRQFNGHLQTIVPSFFRDVEGVNYKRQRLHTPDEDFIDLDISISNDNRENAVLISHGLEGNTGRHYIKGIVKIFNTNGWDAYAWNYRSCSGEMNLLPRFYHHADTPDLGFVIGEVFKINPKIKSLVLIGFSLGGNLTCRYLGENPNGDKRIKAGVAVSVPCDLKRCAEELERPTKHFYNKRFFSKLKEKIEAKSKTMPEHITMEAMEKYNIKSCRLFDEYYTAPLHGFESAEDFYIKAGCKVRLPDIKTPTLLLNAVNDPFLAGFCYPEEIAKNNDSLYLEMPKNGGHTGFEIKNHEFTYAEERAIEFASKYI